MTLLSGLVTRRPAIMKHPGAGSVYANADNLQSSLDKVDRSIQRPIVVHGPGSQKQSPQHKELARRGKQAKHVPALDTITQEGEATEDSGFVDGHNAGAGLSLPQPLPLKLTGSAWWKIIASPKHPSDKLSFITSALDMPTTSSNGTDQLTSFESAASGSFDTISKHKVEVLDEAAVSPKSDTILHPMAHLPGDDIAETVMDSKLEKAAVSEVLNKPLPAKPALRNTESPERRGIIDAFEPGAQALDEKHPALEPNSMRAVGRDFERDEQKNRLENSADTSQQKVQEALDVEKRFYEENVRRVRNNESIENFDLSNIETGDSGHKETSETDEEEASPLAPNSSSQARRNQQFSRIPQANVSLYGSPIARKAWTSTQSSIFSSRSSTGLHRVASRLHNDDHPMPSVSPRIKYGRSAPRIDPEADKLIFGDDPNAQVTNGFRSKRSLRASKETEQLILNQGKVSQHGSPSMIPRSNAANEKFPPRISSLKGSPEAENIEKKFAKCTRTPQSAADRLSRPTTSSNARAADSRAAIAERFNNPKTRAASGTIATHSTRKSFSGRLSAILPRRRTKSSADVEKTAQGTSKTSASNFRLSQNDGRGGGAAVEDKSFGFRKHKTASTSVGRDEQANMNFRTSGNTGQQVNVTNVVNAVNGTGSRGGDNDENPAERGSGTSRRGDLDDKEDVGKDGSKSLNVTPGTQQNIQNSVELQLDVSHRVTTSSPLGRSTAQAAGIGPFNVSASDAMVVTHRDRTAANANGRTRAAHGNARPVLNSAARSTNAVRSSMARREVSRSSLPPTGRPSTAGPSAPRSAGSGRYSTGRHVNIAGSSVASRRDPLSVLDAVDPAIQDQYNETRTTRMLNTLMVDARLSLDRARTLAGLIHDPSLRERLLDHVQDERNLLDCLHHARRAHLAAGVNMFDLFRNVTTNVDELVDRSIDTAVNEEAA